MANHDVIPGYLAVFDNNTLLGVYDTEEEARTVRDERRSYYQQPHRIAVQMYRLESVR